MLLEAMLVSPDQILGLKRSVETLAQRFNGFTLHNDIILHCKNGKKAFLMYLPCTEEDLLLL